MHRQGLWPGILAAVMTGAMISGCASLDAQGTTATTPAPTGPTAEDASRAAQVYVYAGKGQSAQQLDRDRYECYAWAVKQTGFDPSLPSLAPHQRVAAVAGPPPGAETVAGAVAGAVIGAAVSGPGEAGTGAAVGAVIGGALGSASEAARAQEARAIRRRQDALEAERLARIEQQSNNYRRALTACLEGRGYTVK